MLLRGRKFTKTIKVTEYGDEIEIRAITNLEMSRILTKMEKLGMNPTEEYIPTKWNKIMARLACQYGVVDKELTRPILEQAKSADGTLLVDEKEKPVMEPLLDEDGETPLTPIDLLMGQSTLQIGLEILNMSSPNSKELRDFFRVKKEKS